VAVILMFLSMDEAVMNTVMTVLVFGAWRVR
jgi:hypothetical protein